MSFSQKIIELLKEKHMTKAELAKAAGIPYTTLDSMLKRDSDSLRLQSIFKIADHLGVTVEQLVFDSNMQSSGFVLGDTEKSLISEFRRLDNRGKSAVMNLLHHESRYKIGERDRVRRNTLRKIAVYESPAAAGVALPILSEDYEIIYGENVPADADFGIKISGDSMEPLIENGSIAWVKREETIEDGEIGIFILNNESLCKRLKSGAGRCALASVNPKYSDIKVLATDELMIVGKVLI